MSYGGTSAAPVHATGAGLDPSSHGPAERFESGDVAVWSTSVP